MKAPFKLSNFAKKFTFISLLFFSLILTSQTKAFPTALGGGAYSRGDANYEVVEVTNLNPDGPGSFWNALGNNRIVVFRVSGIINMGSIGGSRSLNNCIVLGQTAPEGGITVVGRGWRWDNCTNVVFRYVRFRTWQCQADVWDPCSADSVDVLNSNNIIFDHCSFAYGGDETLSFRGASHTLTVQNCMFSYGKTGMLLGDSNNYDLSYDMSLLNNFFMEISHRFPNPNSNGRVDIIGNLVYSWHNRLMRTGGAVQLNEIGNHYVHPEQELNGNSTWSWNKLDTTPNPPTIYTAMNRATTSLLDSNDDDNTILWQSWQGGRDPLPSDFTSSMFPLLNYTDPLPNGDDTIIKVQNREMGANAYLDNNGDPVLELDDLDLEGYNGFDSREFYDWSTSLNWEDLPQRQWLVDNLPNYGVIQNEHDQSTHTGVVPNIWITSQGLNPGTFNPLGNDLDPTYTNIEIYSFGVDNAEVVAAQGVEVTPESATINIPETIDLDVIFTPANTTNKSGTWTSSDESLATVDANGLVTPIAPGVVTITFTSTDGSFTDTATITITNNSIDATGVEVSPDTMTLDIGQTQQASVAFTPSDTTNQNGSWSSEDENIATVNQDGEVTGVTEGTTTITFTSEDGGFTDTLEVIVADVFFGTYEFYNADTDQLIQLITEDTTFDLEVIGNQVNFRAIPQGGDDNPNVESVLVQWTGPENGEWLQSFPIYSGMAGHDQDIFDLFPYTVSEGTYSFTITYYSADDAQGNVISIDNFDLTFFLDNGVLANAGNDVSICEGESTVLSASGGSNYVWSTGATTNSITVSPATTTVYTVTVSNDLGESDTDEVIVTVNAFPNAQVTPNQTICSGDTVTLTAQGGDSYLWSTGETSASIAVSPSTETEYSVEVISNTCSSTANTTVFVNDTPELTISNDIIIISGESTTLTVGGADSYLWSTGETSASITVSPNQTTTYTVTGFGNSCEAQAEVTVSVEDELVVSAGDDQRKCQDDGIEVTLTASDGDSYLWNTGETTQTIFVNPLSTTTYSVTVTVGNQQATDEVTVFVDPNPNVIIANGDAVDILDGDFVTLSASGANTYEWSNGATQPNIAVSPSLTTTYEVRGYVNDCYDEKQITVNVFPEVIANAGEDQDLCLGESVVLTATGGDEYLWSNGETTASIEVSPEMTTDYTVTVFNALDFDEDTVRVEVSPCDVVSENPDNLSTNFSFDIFPNPARDVVNIRINGSLVVSQVAIYDLMGKLVMDNEIVNNNLSPSLTKELNISTLVPGVYFVRLIDGENERIKKLIVRN